MMKKHCPTVRPIIYVVVLGMVLLLSGCMATLTHTPSEILNGQTVSHPAKIMVADIGDERVGESYNRIGQGVSYWLPLSYYARDPKGQPLPVSFYFAQSLGLDLRKLGYETFLANNEDTRRPVTVNEARIAAKNAGADFLVTTKVNDAKTNFWGFIIIPFFQPVWTRIDIDTQLMDMHSESGGLSQNIRHKETEWYFGKITIIDAIYDAPIFGRHWHQEAWGKTVISDALAKAALDISHKIQGQTGTTLSSQGDH